MALRNLGIDHEVVAISEIDKFAIKSYETIHGETFNLGDISKVKVEDVPDCDLFTYSYPCTDLSAAGLQKGMIRGETRSGLLYECERIIEAKKPKYLLMENVKNLVSKKFKPDFDKWLEYLESLGYTNYWQVLNAKDYGIPQNRQRVFVVSILGEHEAYKFPEPIELKNKMTDLLESDVEESFYLTDKNIAMLTKEDTGKYPRKKRFLDNIEIGNEIARTIQTRQRMAPDENYVITNPSGKTLEEKQLRQLTPLECWRLMGFSDEDFYKAAYELREIIFKGGNESWNVKLADATESQTHENTETFALNIIKDLKGQEEILTEWIKSLRKPENEKVQSVNVVIEKLGELEHSDSVTNIIRCTDYMETLTILMEEKDPLHTVIIELDPKVSTSTAKYMKITSEENLNPLKLSIILTLIEQIIESKIFISTLRKVNICGHISIIENLLSDTENQIELSLKTEGMFTRTSSSQLYKQAGNSIVVNVLEAIFKEMFIKEDEIKVKESKPKRGVFSW